ncbi:NAD(P)-dependent oxidoreductase [Streptacidiphilus anmyonensis]|uniref:NAD(P)-dependent oxidoreductase n=1 Tax=Streptacidiphilus anmyonensis TaxID=405782 RepID=UPI0005A64593|nr:NAD(P)-binding domain-containing protein [Streptacidiphilus anmyonensis]
MPEMIGFIGVGSQGGPMAHRIVDAGLPLTLWARHPEALGPYVAKGAGIAADITELGALSEHVGICVVDDSDVVQVADALIPAMRSGSRIAVHSTVLPATVIDLERRCAEKGIMLIDAPVSGGPSAAEAGELTLMCGGRQEALDAALPVFRTFGRSILLLGPVGSGQCAKIITNAMLSAHMGVAMAALEAGAALDLDRAQLIDVVGVSVGRSLGFEIFSTLPSPQAFAHDASNLLKDMGLLRAALPGNTGARELDTASARFLTAALHG